MNKKECAVVFLTLILLILPPILQAEITGKASSQGVNVSIFVVNPSVNLDLIKPQNKTYISNISLILNFTNSSNDLLYYNLDNGTNITITTPTYFNATEGQHILYLFANNSGGAFNSTNVTFTINLTLLKIIYGEFKTNIADTIDFNGTAYEDLQNLTGIYIKNPHGRIDFTSGINVTDDDNFNDLIVNIDENANISFNRIEINSTGLPNFNTTAKVSLYNLPFSNPRALIDGEICPASICTTESYANSNFTFNVTHFTIYSAEESPTVSSGGGGGGGGGAAKDDLEASPLQLNSFIKQGETARGNFTVTNTGNSNKKIKLTLSGTISPFVKISETEFSLAKGESKTVFVDFFAQEDTTPELYVGNIEISDGKNIETILLSLEISSKKFLFDVIVDIPQKNEIFSPGEKLFTNIKFYNLGLGFIQANVVYTIRDVEGRIILGENQIINLDHSLDLNRTFIIPKDIPAGNYIFNVKVTYDGKSAVASKWFYVQTRKISWMPLLFALIAIFIVYSVYRWLYGNRKKRRK